jgi:bis(5'-nucleosyl)-tetraphosphatase (symmetrical)
MARYAIGDVQGCCTELKALLRKLRFSSDRDRLWFVGDLVNRGPQSLETLRLARSLAANSVVVLGNHDLHLLARAFGSKRAAKDGDSLDDVLAAPDRDLLLEWLLGCPLLHHEPQRNDLLVHAGLLPQWTVEQAVGLAHEVQVQMRAQPREFFDQMYGNQPDRWDAGLRTAERWRLIVNAMTRLRFCTAKGRIDLQEKAAPGQQADKLLPWFDVPQRASASVRIVCGHWSTLGLLRRPDLLALDTGCVWGGALTAVDLDSERAAIAIPCRGYQLPSDA